MLLIFIMHGDVFFFVFAVVNFCEVMTRRQGAQQKQGVDIRQIQGLLKLLTKLTHKKNKCTDILFFFQIISHVVACKTYTV